MEFADKVLARQKKNMIYPPIFTSDSKLSRTARSKASIDQTGLWNGKCLFKGVK